MGGALEEGETPEIHPEKRPHEDTVRRQPPVSQGERPRRNSPY